MLTGRMIGNLSSFALEKGVPLLTVADLKAMIMDLPDETVVLVDVRCSRNIDDFHDPIELSDVSVDLTWAPEIHLSETCCCKSDEHRG